ncbi:MAG: hypothetical protein LBH25_08305 [Fibromonadaceae bacterium]|jgi:hypothetical protein|nr:hypothetical protein [Fibromonadaceae bacterium]
MKLRIAFSVSKDERWLRLSFWDWDIWRSDSVDDYEDLEFEEKKSSKAGFLSFKKTKEETYEGTDSAPDESDFGKLLFQALFYPSVESRIWRICKKLLYWTYKFFSVKLENLEIKGSLDDPFYDAIALGMLGNCYEPDWENENASWSAKGEVVLKASFFYFLFFTLAFIYEATVLALVLWRGTRLAKENPNGENLSEIRRWIFLKAREAA